MAHLSTSGTGTIPPASRHWIELRGLVLIFLFTTLFYLWTAAGGFDRVTTKSTGLDYYNLLVDGFLDGHLSLKFTGTPGIEKLSNPYDPQQNGPFRVMDMSYYHGKYYIYFGPTPALILMLPWRVIFGWSLPSYLAAVVFCTAGYGLALLLLLRWRQRYFPDVGTLPVWLTAIVLGTVNMAPALLRRTAVYEVAISCAYCCVMFSFYALDRARFSVRRPRAWLAAASAAYGLAILGRPTCIYGAVIFLAILGWWWRKRSSAPPGLGRNGQVLLAAFLPIGGLFVGMLLYNYLRFGRPLEFGQIYQLTGRDMSQVKAFSLGYFRFDAWLYLLMPAQYSVYFPFFLNALPPPMPAGYDGLDDLYGILPNLPVMLFAAGILLYAHRQSRAWRRDVLSLSGGLMLWTVAVFGVFLFFSGATIRYYLDFLPGWLLVACLGLWTIGTYFPRGIWRVLAWTGVTTVSLYSVAFAVMVSFQHAGLLRAANPEAFASLAQKANMVSNLYDKFARPQFGPMLIKLKFPTGRTGKFEPLLVTGAFPQVDYVWVLYTDESHLQLGYEHTNYGGKASQPIAIDYSRPHQLQIEAGMLYPPEAHPYFHGRDNEAAQLSRVLRISLDGTPYIDANVARYDPISATVKFGRNSQTTTFGTRFTGQVLSVARVPAAPVVDETPRRGPARLSVIWPTGRAGHREPLIVTGKTGAGDILYIEYLSDTSARFVLDHWGVGAVTSPPVTILPGQIQALDVTMDSLDGKAEGVPEGRIILALDGKEVMNAVTGFHPAPLSTQTIGSNVIGGSTAESFFTGKIVGVYHPSP